MSRSVPAESGEPVARRRVAWLGTVVCLALVSAAGGFAWRQSATGRSPRTWIGALLGRSGAEATFRLAAESPYKNVRPGVKYVGDAACVRCHGEISETYRKHPMGRSLGEVRSVTIPGQDS